jgi:hypothetical protein
LKQNPSLDQATCNKIVSFIWGIADDVLRDLFKRGEYPDVILPMWRVDWLAVLLLIVTDVVFNLWWYGGGNAWVHVAFLALIMSISALVLVRFGLLALAAEWFFFSALQSLPIAPDLGAWYAGHALLALGLLATAAAVAFHVSLAGRPAFGGRPLEE